jgi:hypothetical protein
MVGRVSAPLLLLLRLLLLVAGVSGCCARLPACMLARSHGRTLAAQQQGGLTAVAAGQARIRTQQHVG